MRRRGWKREKNAERGGESEMEEEHKEGEDGAQTKKKKILVGTNNTKRLTAGRARQNERTSYARGASSTTNGHRNRRTVDHAHAHEKKSYPSPASASPQSGAAEEDTDWREELELLSMARQNRSSRPSSALGSGDAEKSDLGMSSALDSLKSKIRDSVALAAEKKTTVDPVRQRARMKILSRPVREDGRKKKKEPPPKLQRVRHKCPLKYLVKRLPSE